MQYVSSGVDLQASAFDYRDEKVGNNSQLIYMMILLYHDNLNNDEWPLFTMFFVPLVFYSHIIFFLHVAFHRILAL